VLRDLHLETISDFLPKHITRLPPGLKNVFLSPKYAWSDEDLMKLVAHAPNMEKLYFSKIVYFSHPISPPPGEKDSISMSETSFTVCDHIGRVTRRRAANPGMQLLHVNWQLWSPPGMVMQLKDDGLRLPPTLTYLNLQGIKLPCDWTFKMTSHDLGLHLSLLNQLVTLIIAFPLSYSCEPIDISAISRSMPLLQRMEIKLARCTNLHLAALPRPLTVLKIHLHSILRQVDVPEPPKWAAAKLSAYLGDDPEISSFYSIIRDEKLALCLDYMPVHMKVFCMPNAHFLSKTIRDWPQDMDKASIRMDQPHWTPMQQLLFADNFSKGCNLNIDVDE
jgi:hypothetical protein